MHTTMDEATRRKTAADFYNAAQTLMANLVGRWQDEKEHEDINDYKRSIESVANQFGITIVKMTKRPFGCHFTLGGCTYTLTMSATGMYNYKRIA